jgi:hypothetical protein
VSPQSDSESPHPPGPPLAKSYVLSDNDLGHETLSLCRNCINDANGEAFTLPVDIEAPDTTDRQSPTPGRTILHYN